MAAPLPLQRRRTTVIVDMLFARALTLGPYSASATRSAARSADVQPTYADVDVVAPLSLLHVHDER